MSIHRRAETVRRDTVRKEQRQTEIITLAAEGQTNREIAQVFGISPTTVSRDISASLQEYHTQRMAMSELWLDDQLREIDRIIDLIAPMLTSEERSRSGEPVLNADGSVRRGLDKPLLAEYRNWLSERARLLGLYPNANSSADGPKAAPQIAFYIDFGASGGSPSPAQADVIQGIAHAVSGHALSDDDAQHTEQSTLLRDADAAIAMDADADGSDMDT